MVGRGMLLRGLFSEREECTPAAAAVFAIIIFLLEFLGDGVT